MDLVRSNDILDLLSTTSQVDREDPEDLTEDSVLDGEMLARIEQTLASMPPPSVVVQPARGLSRGGLAAMVLGALALRTRRAPRLRRDHGELPGRHSGPA